jgi:hypothetical protein
MEYSGLQTLPMPDMQALRHEAVAAGALDPTTLRFRVVEYDKLSGEMLGVPIQDIGFFDAVEKTARLIQSRADSHFCLHPVGFIQ